MKIIAPLLGVALLAQGVGTPPPRPQTAVTQEAIRQIAQPLGAEPFDVLEAEKAWAGEDVLFSLLQSDQRAVRSAAMRALGRLENAALVPPLISVVAKDVVFDVRAAAIAQSLHGFDPTANPSLVANAFDVIYPVAALPLNRDTLPRIASAASVLARIKYVNPDHVHKIEDVLLKLANYTQSDTKMRGDYLQTAQALETLLRLNARTIPPGDDTIECLEKMVANSHVNDTDSVRGLAFAALVSARAVKKDSLRLASKEDWWQTRRQAVLVLAGGASDLDGAERASRIADALADPEAHVRYEALRAYVRVNVKTDGCGRVLDLMNDPDAHVSLAAIDALGDNCREDEKVTERIVGELRVPASVGSWHRDTHVFMAAAKRSPQSVTLYTEAFVTHPVWWVRMYSAPAMAAAGDLIHLEKLVFDADDNVREAALGAWVRLKKDDAEPALLSALERTDVQLLRATADFMRQRPRTPRYFKPLFAALMRLTTEGKETSRDARLPLLEAILVHAPRENAVELAPLLKDFDPIVAQRAAEVMTRLTDKPAAAQPQPYRRGGPQAFKELRQCVSVQMDSGRSFRMQMEPSLAPVAVDRFLKVALTDKYYNGLSFHRVVPNFVIQGGSPGANEYSGAKEFWRDEFGGRHVRGTVGLSTRGHNTADSQFFINLVDNFRLDDDYTVFARVFGEDMENVDKILEGDVMRAINPIPCPDIRRR